MFCGPETVDVSQGKAEGLINMKAENIIHSTGEAYYHFLTLFDVQFHDVLDRPSFNCIKVWDRLYKKVIKVNYN